MTYCMDMSLTELVAYLGIGVKDPQAKADGYFSSLNGAPCYYLRPDRSDIRLRDIAYTLSRTPRWGGRTRVGLPFWSVAEHSILCFMLVDEKDEGEALCHDLVEAFLGDCPTPLKRLLKDYPAIEHLWQKDFAERSGLRLDNLPDDVKKADLIALALERHDFMNNTEESWRLWGNPQRPLDYPWVLQPEPNKDDVAEVFLELLKAVCPNFIEGPRT